MRIIIGITFLKLACVISMHECIWFDVICIIMNITEIIGGAIPRARITYLKFNNNNITYFIYCFT